MLPAGDSEPSASRKLTLHRVELGEQVFADASAIIEMTVNNGTGLILYDRRRSVAAAGLVTASGGGDASFRERADACGLSLLSRLLRTGSVAEEIEIFALGSYLPAMPAGLEGSRPGALPAGRRLSWHCPSAGGGACRVEFQVARGRLVVEPERAAGGPAG